MYKKISLRKELKTRLYCKKASLHKSEISRIENGQINIGVTTLIEIAKAIDIPLKLLLDDGSFV